MATPILELLNQVDWQDVPPPTSHKPGALYATHSGTLEIAGFKLDALILNDGQRIFTKESVDAFFGALGDG